VSWTGMCLTASAGSCTCCMACHEMNVYKEACLFVAVSAAL
jgi:hypothetical protein